MFTRRELLKTAAGAALLTAGAHQRVQAQVSRTPTVWKDLETAAKPFGGRTIRILGEDLPPLHSLNRIQGEFKAKTQATLDIDFKNHSGVIQSVLAGALNRSYRYDIIFVPHKELGRLIEIKAIKAIDSIVANAALRDPSIQPTVQFFDPFWTEVATYRNNWYAVPLYLGGSIVVCRGDLVNAANEQNAFSKKYSGNNLSLPNNFAEWRRLAEFFYRPNATPPLFGIALLLSEESLWYEWQSVLFAFGGNVLDAKHSWEYGDIVVNSPQAIAATEAYYQLSKFCPPDASAYSWGLGIAKQQAGQNFMTLLQYDVVAEFEDPQKTALAGKFDYFLPVGPDGRRASQMESWVGVIPASARSPELSWLLLQWMMGPDIQLRMHLEGNVSPRKSTYDDPRVKAMRPTKTILESVPLMVPKPTIPEASAIQQILTRQLQQVMSGAQPAKVSLNRAAVEIGQRLGRRAKLRYPVGASGR